MSSGRGVLLAGWKAFGDLGTWVPAAALFVLIIGRNHPWQYLASYSGLILLGGMIGALVALLFPQMPITPADRAVARLRHALTQPFNPALSADRADVGFAHNGGVAPAPEEVARAQVDDGGDPAP